MAEAGSFTVLGFLLGGLIVAYGGYWIHHLALEAVGFVAGGGLVWLLISWGFIEVGQTSTLLVTGFFILISGIIGSFIATKMERLFISTLGSMAGATLAGMLLSIDNTFFSPQIALVSIFSGILTWKLFRYAVKFITAILGAYLTTVGYTLFMDPTATITATTLYHIAPLPFYTVAVTGAGIQTGILHPLKWMDALTADPESEHTAETADH